MIARSDADMMRRNPLDALFRGQDAGSGRFGDYITELSSLGMIGEG